MALKIVKFRDYSGFVIRGTTSIPADALDMNLHLHRAFLLTAKIESGATFGTVMNYDGTAMTAGLHQAIAVYPKLLAPSAGAGENAQGSLWRMLRLIELVPGPCPPRDKLWKMLADKGWFIDASGTLRTTATGALVSGVSIREAFTGPDGQVATKGEAKKEAEGWVQAFADLFAHPATFQVQIEYGLEHITKAVLRWRVEGRTLQESVYGGRLITKVTRADLGDELDLAMAMFWSHSVNAPSKAQRLLETAAKIDPVGTARFPARLIKTLGETTFGRWDDDEPGGRYQRTRSVAMKLWPPELFDGPKAIYPKNLPG